MTYAGREEQTNWIPPLFQRAAQNLGREAVSKFVRGSQVVGLGSGPMAAAIVREMADMKNKEALVCVSTSFQIKLEAECSGLKIVDESYIPEIDVVFDGADEVDSKFNMIKGGGGALEGKNNPLCSQESGDCCRIKQVCPIL